MKKWQAHVLASLFYWILVYISLAYIWWDLQWYAPWNMTAEARGWSLFLSLFGSAFWQSLVTLIILEWKDE